MFNPDCEGEESKVLVVLFHSHHKAVCLGDDTLMLELLKPGHYKDILPSFSKIISEYFHRSFFSRFSLAAKLEQLTKKYLEADTQEKRNRLIALMSELKLTGIADLA